MSVSTDGFLWMLRARDEKRSEVARLRRELSEAERELRELSEAIDKETAPQHHNQS